MTLDKLLEELRAALEEGEAERAAAIVDDLLACRTSQPPLAPAQVERARALVTRCLDLAGQLHAQSARALATAASVARARAAYPVR